MRAKNKPRGWNPFLIGTRCRLLLTVLLSRGNVGQAANKSEPFHSIWISLLGTSTSAHIHMHFSTWDVPKVGHFIWISVLRTPNKCTKSYDDFWGDLPKASHFYAQNHMNFFTWQVLKFIWISLFGICQKRATSYEFLYLGHPKCTKSHEFLYLGRAKSEPLQLNFCTWDTPQVNKIIWIPWCGHPAVKELMWIWAHVFSQIKSLRGGNTRLRGRIARAPFRRSFVSRLAMGHFFRKGTCKTPVWGMYKRPAHLILFGVQGTHLFIRCPKVLSHVQPFSCFSIRSAVLQNVYLLNSAAWVKISWGAYVIAPLQKDWLWKHCRQHPLVYTIKARLLVHRFKKLKRQRPVKKHWALGWFNKDCLPNIGFRWM